MKIKLANTYSETDWSRWLFGFEVDSDLHWTDPIRYYDIGLFLGPFAFGVTFKREYN